MKPAEYAKAITSALVTSYAIYQSALVATSPGGVGVTSDEWVGIAVSALLAGIAVWLIPNTKSEPTVANTLTIEQTSTGPTSEVHERAL
jgi:hypothetical protein